MSLTTGLLILICFLLAAIVSRPLTKWGRHQNSKSLMEYYEEGARYHEQEAEANERFAEFAAKDRVKAERWKDAEFAAKHCVNNERFAEAAAKHRVEATKKRKAAEQCKRELESLDGPVGLESKEERDQNAKRR